MDSWNNKVTPFSCGPAKKNWLLRGPAGGKAFARFNLYSKVTQWNLTLQPIKRLSKNKAMTGKRKNYIQPSAKKNLQKFWNTAFVLWFLTNRRGPQFSVDLRSGLFSIPGFSIPQFVYIFITSFAIFLNWRLSHPLWKASSYRSSK